MARLPASVPAITSARRRSMSDLLLWSPSSTVRRPPPAPGQPIVKPWQSPREGPRWAAATCERGPVRVLVVEDDDSIAAPLAKGLAREGFDVERVATGE